MLPEYEMRQRGTKQMPFACYKIVRKQKNFLITKPHWHREIEMIFVEKGEILVTVQSEAVLLCEGEIAFVSPNELHSVKSVSNDVCYYAMVFAEDLLTFPKHHFFQKQFTEPVFSVVATLPRKILKNDTIYNEVFKCFKAIVKTENYQSPEILPLLLSLFITIEKNQLLSNNAKSKERFPISIKNSLNFMFEHFGEKITLSDLANAACLSPNYFCSCFKSCTGVTPFEQLHSLRIDRAATILENSDLSIEETARQCGFDNVGFFIKVFKQRMGQTPATFRKDAKNLTRG